MDITTHARTYDRVMGMLKYGTVVCVIAAAFVIWLIAG